MDTIFPQLKGLKSEITRFVWFQGWNGMFAAKYIQEQVNVQYLLEQAFGGASWLSSAAATGRLPAIGVGEEGGLGIRSADDIHEPVWKVM